MTTDRQRMAELIVYLYRKIFGRPAFKRFNLALFNLSLKGLGIKNHQNDDVSGENYFIDYILPSVINENNPIVFDVGANIGDYTAYLLTRFPQAFIHAFEPHPVNYSRLLERKFPEHVIRHNLALGQNAGVLTLYDRRDRDGSRHASLYEEVISEIHKQETSSYDVKIETLDNFAEANKIERIDFLKIDAEGNELSILSGAEKLLGNGRIGCVQFEFNEMNVISRVFFRDFRKLLHNYELYRLLPRGLLRLEDIPLETEIFAFQNIVALPPTMFDNH